MSVALSGAFSNAAYHEAMRAGVLLLVLLAVLSCVSASAGSASRSEGATATGHAVDPAKLRAAEARMARSPGLTSVLVLRQGRLLLERYYHGGSRDRSWSMYSVTKSVVSALVGIALREGRLESVRQRVVRFFPGELTADVDPRVREITLRDLLTMSAGYRDVNTPYETDDWVRALLDRPLASEPGAAFSYDDGSVDLLSAVLTKVTGVPAAVYAQRELFGPLGIRPARWNGDGQGHSLGSGGLFLRTREMARLGRLYLDGGRWRGRQILPRAWVRDSTREQIRVPGGGAYGYLWWIGRGADRGFAAEGFGGQEIAVVPRLSLVIVLTGVDLDPRPLTKLLLRAVA
jgi:CubicO group peptidase (beta-lactamase class C family)